jgi:plastocyanin
MPPVAAAAAQTVEVQLREQTYQPPLIRVRPGDTILFRNQDPYVHGVTLIHHEDTLDQGFIEPLQTLTFVVPKDVPPGEYPLGCTIHINMRGTLIVGHGP